MASRATMIADALRPKKAEAPPPDVFSAPKQSWSDYVSRETPLATGYEGMPAPQAEGMPEHDPNGTVSRIANALATLPTVQSIKEQMMLPRQILSGEKGVPQSFGPTTPDAQTDEAIGFGLGNAVRPGAAMSIAKMPLASGEAVLGAGPIRAYHGSPHDFDKFDLSKIGTGEGAQAYGHGLYFAESEGVARNYRDALSGKAMDDRTPLAAAQRAVALSGDNGIDGALKILEGNLKSSRITAEKVPHLASRVPEYEEAIALLKGDKVPPPGRMYEVAIHADPERFLDWDKPLGEQGDAAKRALMPFVERATKGDPEAAARGLKGGTVYADFAAETGGSPTASQALREAGIPGIKYLDQGSRGGRVGLPAGPHQDVIRAWMEQAGNDPAKAIALMEEHGAAIGRPSEMAEPIKTLREWSGPTSNYVLFDDKIVEILRKYGVGSIAALPPAVQMAIQLHQDQTQAEPQEPTFAGKASKMINDLQRKLHGPEPPATPLGMGIRG